MNPPGESSDDVHDLPHVGALDLRPGGTGWAGARSPEGCGPRRCCAAPPASPVDHEDPVGHRRDDRVAPRALGGDLQQPFLPLLAQPPGLDGKRPLLQAVLDGQQQLVRRERLGDVAVRALPRAFHGRVQRGVGGDDDGHDVGVPVSAPPGSAPGPDIRGICRSTSRTANGPALDQLLQPRLAVPGRHHLVAFGGEDLPAALAHAQLVIHHEDARGPAAPAACRQGRRPHGSSSLTRRAPSPGPGTRRAARACRRRPPRSSRRGPPRCAAGNRIPSGLPRRRR